jgi:uncharacterized membrane protein
LATATVFALINPPFQAADEATQFYRATQVADGGLLPVNGPHTEGAGILPLALYRLADSFDDLHFRSAAPVDPTRLRAAETLRWPPQSGLRSAPNADFGWVGFANTAIYPPWFYLPQAIAIDVGRAVGLPMIATLRSARLAVSFTAIMVVAVALITAGRGVALAAAVLSLPMTLALFAAAGQDGPLIATAALVASLLSNLSLRRGSWTRWLVCGLALGAVGAARLPYIALAGLPVIVAWEGTDRTKGIAAGVLAALVALAWLHFGAGPVMFETHAGGTALSGAQMHFLLAHPTAIPRIALHTLATNSGPYWHEFVGVLNWFDVPLPAWAYPSAGVILVAIVGLSCATGHSDLSWTSRALIAGVLVLTIGLIFGALYLTWTPRGALVVDGVQGRYFIPVALMAILLLPPSRPGWPYRIATGLVAIMLLTDLAVLPGLIEQHYRAG